MEFTKKWHNKYEKPSQKMSEGKKREQKSKFNQPTNIGLGKRNDE